MSFRSDGLQISPLRVSLPLLLPTVPYMPYTAHDKRSLRLCLSLAISALRYTSIHYHAQPRPQCPRRSTPRRGSVPQSRARPVLYYIDASQNLRWTAIAILWLIVFHSEGSLHQDCNRVADFLIFAQGATQVASPHAQSSTDLIWKRSMTASSAVTASRASRGGGGVSRRILRYLVFSD